MKKKDLLIALINHYTSVIKEVEAVNKVVDILVILRDTQTNLGFCSCAQRKFNTNIYHKSEWIDKHINGTKFHLYPSFYYTKRQILASLNYRLDILNKENNLTK